MTQIQLTDQQLNRALAELMGWKNIEGHAGDYLHDSGRWLRSHIRDYCTEPAASLEVQTAAMKIDAIGFIKALQTVKWGTYHTISNHGEIADLFSATLRERAEAAYITMQGAKG